MSLYQYHDHQSSQSLHTLTFQLLSLTAPVFWVSFFPLLTATCWPHRRGLHLRVLPVPTRLVQLGAGILLLSAVSQRHLLRQGGVVLHALPRPPLLTYERGSAHCHPPPLAVLKTLLLTPALPSAQTRAGRSAKSSCRARRRISSRSTRPATARGRSVSASLSVPPPPPP